MRQKTIMAALLILITVISCFTLMGQTRVRFKRGTSSAVIKGKLSSRVLERVYLVGAKRGQTLDLKVRVKSDQGDAFDFVNVSVTSPSGRPLSNAAEQNGSHVSLPETGSYRISLSPPGRFYREHISGYIELTYWLTVAIY